VAYSPRQSSRRRWQKLKLELSQEFVEGGYRPGATRSTRCWGLLRRAEAALRAQVQGGFVAHVRSELFKCTRSTAHGDCPFASPAAVSVPSLDKDRELALTRCMVSNGDARDLRALF
jgi:hypothetical protein